MINNILIRKMVHSDIASLMEVEKSSFSVPWSEKSFKDELQNDAAVYFVALHGEKVIGYIGMWDVSGEGDITNIAVHPEYRGRGIGKQLLKSVFCEAGKRGLCTLTLEVRESNAIARQLYTSCGFSAVGMRKNYYSDNRENAVIMTADLNN